MTPKQNLTIDDIARDLGVSKTTVSRAISGKGRISAATRERVLSYIEAMNYRPSAAAKGLAESKTYNIALVLPKAFVKLDLPYIRQSMGAMCEEAYLWNYYILVCLTPEDQSTALLHAIDNRKVDGVILARTVQDDALVELLHKRGIPFATVGSLPHALSGTATVEGDHDQKGGCYAFSRMLLEQNDQSIAVLGNDMNYMVNQSRLAGFRQACTELHFPEELVFVRTGLGDRQKCTAAANALFDQGIRRFLCMDDEVCIRVTDALEQRGVRIPEEVQIASMYDSELLKNHHPAISALCFDAAELGRVICRELLRSLNEEDFDPQPILGYRIALRDSTK